MMEYKPYGKEWEKDMMQMTKKELIEFIRTILKKNLDNGWGGMMDFVYVVLGVSVLLALLKIAWLLDDIKEMLFNQNFYK